MIDQAETDRPNEAPTITAGTVAGLFSGGDNGSYETFEALLTTLVEHHPEARAAYRTIECRAAVAGLPTRGEAWPGTVLFVYRAYDELAAMAEPSGWADPAMLLDPDGGDGGIHYEPLVRIARHRRDTGGDDGSGVDPARLVRWLEHGAAVEDGPEGYDRRRAERLCRWPFNAAGAMDDARGGAEMRMVSGALRPIERRFRIALARAWNELGTGRRDVALDVLDALAADTAERSRRMHALALAGIARVHLAPALDALTPSNGSRATVPPTVEVAHRHLRAAADILLTGRLGTDTDRRALHALRAAFTVVARRPAKAPTAPDPEQPPARTGSESV